MASSAKARLNHAAIFVSDLDRSITFYEQAFGLTLKARWKTGERVTDGKEETMGLPGAHLIDSKGCRIELWELADQTGSEHTQKPVNHFGMEVDDLAQVYENAIAAGAKAEMPPSTVTSDGVFEDGALWKHGNLGQGIYIDPARDFVGVYFSTNGYIPPYGEDKMPGYLRRAAKYLAGR
jgi:catechol 2,3-dioxygenase-like lactoylglutathione lyase family enzyme